VTAITVPVLAPATLGGTPTAPAVSLTWTRATNATAVQVMRNGANIGAPLASNATSYTDSTVSLNTTYTYTVCATAPNAVNSPACSNTVSITVAVPAAPTSVTVTAVHANGNHDTMTVTWTQTSNNESGFRIR